MCIGTPLDSHIGHIVNSNVPLGRFVAKSIFIVVRGVVSVVICRTYYI